MQPLLDAGDLTIAEQRIGFLRRRFGGRLRLLRRQQRRRRGGDRRVFDSRRGVDIGRRAGGKGLPQQPSLFELQPGMTRLPPEAVAPLMGIKIKPQG